jgi:hypothetical protein
MNSKCFHPAGTATAADAATTANPAGEKRRIGEFEPMSSPANPGTQGSTIPMGLRILAIVLRALFLGALVAISVRLSRPQSETIWSVYETPGDLIRLMLGVAVCLWIVLHLFMLPRTVEGYRSWVYLGLVVAPLAWAVAIAIW